MTKIFAYLVSANLALAPVGAVAEQLADPILKPGWTEASIAAFAAGCAQGIIDPAKRDYAAAAQRAGDINPKPFPEAELRASVVPMCSCLAIRIAEAQPFDQELLANMDRLQPMIKEALSGGRCKPGGILGQMLASPAPR